MTVRVNGSPDRHIKEIDTFGGGSGGVGSNVVVDNPQDIASANLLLILTELGNILTELQGAITVNLGTTDDLATETTLDEFRDSFLLEDFATEATLLPVRNRFSPSLGASPSSPYNTSGDKLMHTPALGSRIRLKWVGASSDVTQSAIPIKWRFGAGSYFWHWLLFGGFAHGAVREGAVDEPLYLNLANNGIDVYAAFDIEEFV